MPKIYLTALCSILYIASVSAQSNPLAQALAYWEQTDYGAALPLLRVQAAEFFNAKPTEEAALAAIYMGRIFIRQGKLDSAKVLSERLAARYNTDTSMEALTAEVMNLQGEVALFTGQATLAQARFKSALAWYEQYKPSHTRPIAALYAQIGVSFNLEGKRNPAIEYHTKALRLREALQPASPADVAASLNDLGLVYGLAEPERAIEYYQRALAIYRMLYGETHSKTANAYNNLAIAYQQQKDYPAARLNYEKTLDIRERIFGKTHPAVAFVYANLGGLALAQEQYFEATAYLQQALKDYKMAYGNIHPEIANVLNQLATVQLRERNYVLALQTYQEALQANHVGFASSIIYQNPPIQGYLNADILLNTLVLKAQALELYYTNKSLRHRDLNMALNTVFSADSLITALRQVRQNKQDQIALSAIAREINEDGIRLALSLAEVSVNKYRYREIAFDFAEKSKAAALLTAIAEANAKEFAGIPTALLNQELSLRGQISYYEQKVAQMSEDNALYRERLFVLNREYEQLIRSLEQDFPEYYNLKFNTQNLSLKELQSTLTEQTAVLSYFIGEKSQRLYIFGVSAKSFGVWDLPLIENLEGKVVALRNALQFQSRRLLTQIAPELYAQLIPNLPSYIRHLLIVPDGILSTIPFETLLSSRPKSSLADSALPYLLQRYAVSYAYSLTLYHQHHRRVRPSKSSASNILLYAPVDFGTSAPALPATVEEVNRIAAVYPSWAKVYLYEAAQEQRLKASPLRDFSFLHFATHGTVNEETPELSQIFLLSDPSQQEDGRLFSGEIYNLQLNAALVTLSACETGLGKLARGEGVVGLARAWLYAGARNVLVSFWRVSDQSTATLMAEFYRSLPNATSNPTQAQGFAEYLRQVKLRLLATPQTALPYYWSAFVLIGE